MLKTLQQVPVLYIEYLSLLFKWFLNKTIFRNIDFWTCKVSQISDSNITRVSYLLENVFGFTENMLTILSSSVPVAVLTEVTENVLLDFVVSSLVLYDL